MAKTIGLVIKETPKQEVVKTSKKEAPKASKKDEK